MKALILGANGQVGGALAATAPAGATIISCGRAECDIADPDAIASVIDRVRPDLVFNAAGYTAVDKAESEPEVAHRLNAVAPGLVAGAARRAGARTVQLSTDFVFDGRAGSPRGPADPVGPESVYARTKLEGEQRAAAADPDALIVRTAWVYAARGSNFVNTMLRLMKERDTLYVVADQIGTPTWAKSLAGALWSLAAAGAKGVFHYTDAGVASWYDFAVAIEEEARAAALIPRPVAVVPIATQDFPTAARRPAYSVLDKQAAWALIGRAAPHWRVNLRASLEESKANG